MRPPYLAGRDNILGAFDLALKSGPRNPRFVGALIGERGIGKTVLLNEMGEKAKQLGWPVVARQITPNESFLVPLLYDLLGEAGSKRSQLVRRLRELDVELTMGVDAKVAKIGATTRRSAPKKSELSDLAKQAIIEVGEKAQRSKRGVLITVDEMHELDKYDELAAFASALQQVVMKSSLPVSVQFAGLPTLRSVLKNAGTYLERLSFVEVGSLGKDATKVAFLLPAQERGVIIEATALSQMTEAADGYPYLVQLIGYHTWLAKGDDKKIESEAARIGIAAAQQQMEGLFLERWNSLSNLERSMVAVIAREGGSATSEQVSKALKRSTEALGSTRASLINKRGLLHSPRRGTLEISLPGFSTWISNKMESDSDGE
jgi:hypothetical protein